MRLPTRLQARFREATLALFVAAMGLAIVGIARVMSAGAGAIALCWGIAAAAFAIGFTIRASISFIYNDADYTEVWTWLAAFMYLVFAGAAFSWTGGVAAVFVIAAWLLGRMGHREEYLAHRRQVRARRNAGRRLRRGRPPPEDLSQDSSSLDLTGRDKLRLDDDAFGGNAETRRGAIERARMIDGNPWGLPPD